MAKVVVSSTEFTLYNMPVLFSWVDFHKKNTWTKLKRIVNEESSLEMGLDEILEPIVNEEI